MKRALLLLALLGAMLVACAGVVLAQQTTPPESTSPETATPTSSPSESSSTSVRKTPKDKKVSGSYIVVLNEDADPVQVAGKKKQEIGDLNVKHVYRNALKGFAVEVPDEEASKLRDNPEVKYVEQDREVAITTRDDDKQKKAEQSDSGDKTGKSGGDDSATQSKGQQKESGRSGGGGVSASGQTLPWGINRIDADISSTQAGNGSGEVANVNAYIIDTGIYKHSDLNVVGHSNFTGDGKDTDCHGHGTHVAGTVAAMDNGSAVVGVAPGAPLTGVKVLNCNGSGKFSDVIKGIDWVTANAQKPAIANMSLGGEASDALDEAVRNSAASGVFYSIAAGNDGKLACEYSPARAGAGTNNGIMTVAATSGVGTEPYKDAETSWSNYGSCVDIWEPGANILSTKRGGGTTNLSGTSMAAPHTGGAAALYLSAHTGTLPAEVEEQKKADAVLGENRNRNPTSKDGTVIKIGYAGKY